jgi:hypothetical protein
MQINYPISRQQVYGYRHMGFALVIYRSQRFH